LWVYTALHFAHERGIDLPVGRAISCIPLFSTCALSLATAAATSIVVALALRMTRRRPYAVPRILAVSIGLFAAVMVLFP
jgi:hypothetical protein